MEEDARVKRMNFIRESTDIREMFSWAHPVQVLEAIRVYTTSFYGSMLYDLYGEEANMIYRCWNTAVKLVWDVPRNTSTFLVENLLGGNIQHVRGSILKRYTMFCQKLLKSSSTEIRILASISAEDTRSNMGRNLMCIGQETGLDPLRSGKLEVGETLEKTDVPLEDTWKIPLLKRLLEERQEQRDGDCNTKETDELITVVCTSTFI
jgi:hypothetical protein